MDRARRAALTALIVVVMIAAAGGSEGPGESTSLAAVVGWPTSSLVVSEILTGGASASDEFIEIANQGTAPTDLLGLEVVYVTSSGSTVTRKASWDASRILSTGQRFLIGNASGSYAASADSTYTGGMAATGGAVALRVVGGSVIDAVGWGDATNGFVEGAAGSTPPAGSSLERLPGAAAGNGTDTNDNATDWFIQGGPSPQNLGSPTVPTQSPTPTPEPTATTPPPSSDPSPTPAPSPLPSPTPAPSTPPPSASPSPTPTPSPTPISIADARLAADGAVVSIHGTLTTALGALESGRTGFVQDGTAGIAIYLDSQVIGSWPAGTDVTVRGTVGSRFSQRTLRASESAVERGATPGIPVAQPIATGDALEPNEGRRVAVTGVVSGPFDALSDGLGINVDDGSGPVRAVVGADALGAGTIESGMIATVLGPLGQRDSSGTGSAGYRIYATLPGDLSLTAPTPTPTPTPSPTPTPTPTPDPSPTPGSSPSPTPAPSVTPDPGITVASVRALPVGTRVTVTGVVTAEAGRLGTPALLAIGDATAGIAVRLPSDTAPMARGTLVRVEGTLSAPFGQLEIRPLTGGIMSLGLGALPGVLPVGSVGLDESIEGRLVSAVGLLSAKPRRSSGGDLTITLERDGASSIKVIADSSSLIAQGAFTVGTSYQVTGVVGQRASKKDAPDGYRICLRDSADLAAGSPGLPTPSAGSLRRADPDTDGSATRVLPIAEALRTSDTDVAIEAVVTAPAALLDTSNRRIVVQDGGAAIELLVPVGIDAPPVGTRIHADGRVGVAYGAPRFRATNLARLAPGRAPAPVVLRAQPGEGDEWRLVAVTGRIERVAKLGDRWRAELVVGSRKVPIVGQPGSGIAAGRLVEGRIATIVGIVRRPFPTASDRRFSILPRSTADVRVEGGVFAGQAARGTNPDGAGPAGSSVASTATTQPADADLIDLGGLVGRMVRVGGLVTDLRVDGVMLDDGTTIGRLVLRAGALDLLPLLEPDDAVNAVGRVEALDDGFAVVVEDPGGISQAGDPTAAEPGASPVGDGASIDPATPLIEAGVGGGASAGTGVLGFATLGLVSGLSLAITLTRRWYLRRRLAGRIAVRLAELDGRSTAAAGPRSAERGGGTIHSA